MLGEIAAEMNMLEDVQYLSFTPQIWIQNHTQCWVTLQRKWTWLDVYNFRLVCSFVCLAFLSGKPWGTSNVRWDCNGNENAWRCTTSLWGWFVCFSAKNLEAHLMLGETAAEMRMFEDVYNSCWFCLLTFLSEKKISTQCWIWMRLQRKRK